MNWPAKLIAKFKKRDDPLERWRADRAERERRERERFEKWARTVEREAESSGDLKL